MAAVRRDCIGCVVVIGRFEVSREPGLWFVRRGSGDCDVLIAGSFLCGSKQRGGQVLGGQYLWQSDCTRWLARGLGVRGETLCG